MDPRPLNRVLRQLRTSATPGGPPTDRDLVEAYLHHRDEAAFAELLRRHERTVQYACRQVLSRQADIDDAFQATFLVLLRRARHIRWQASLGSWLFAVAHRVAVRLATSQRTTPPRPRPEPTVRTPADELSWREACTAVHEELNRLPDRFRLPLMLCYLQGYSRDEAARHLGWTPGSVKAGLERGREALRRRLEQRGVTLTAGLLSILARPSPGDASVSLSQSVLSILTGAASHRALALSRQVALTAPARLALLTFVLFLTTTAGLAFAWAGTTAPPATDAAIATVSLPHPADPNDPVGEPIIVTGTVVDENDKPLSGVKLYAAPTTKWEPRRPDTAAALLVGSTDDIGQFRVEVRLPKFHLIATRPGYGPDWEGITKKPIQSIKLRLPNDLPIVGKLEDGEGKPVAGAVIRCRSLGYLPDTSMEDALAAMPQDSSGRSWENGLKSLWFGLGPLLGQARSGPDGIFTLTSVGQNRRAYLQIEAKGYAAVEVNVLTLPGFEGPGTAKHHLTAEKLTEQLHESNAARLKQTPEQQRGLFPAGHLFYHAAKNVYHLEPERVIEGTITELGTGRPVPNLRLTARSERPWVGRAGQTDTLGHYRIEGLGRHGACTVETEYDDRYLRSITSALERAGADPVRVDLKVRPGAALRGKVIDSKTGQGVPARITVKPAPGNPYLTKAGIHAETTTSTADDGTFRLVAVPGDVIVTATPLPKNPDDPTPNLYLPARIRPEHADAGLLSERTGDGFITFNHSNTGFRPEYAYQLLELDLGSEQTVELVLMRGKEITVKVLDPEGKPVAAGTIAGLSTPTGESYERTLIPFAKSTFEVIAPTAEQRSRTLYIINPARNLGGRVTLRSDEPGPVEVRLEPLGTITGQLVDAQQPFPDQDMRLTSASENSATAGTEPLRRREPRMLFGTCKTDADGRYTFRHVLPDVPLEVAGPRRQDFSTYSKSITLAAGETRDIGKMGVSRPRFRKDVPPG